MKIEAYGSHLRELGLIEKAIQNRITAVTAFVNGMQKLGIQDLSIADKQDMYRYAQTLIAEGSNTPQVYDALRDYLLWLSLKPQYIALVEITDCYNGMEKLADSIENHYGADMREQIFSISKPPLGADEVQRYAYTQAIQEKMSALLTPEQIRAAWFEVQHGIPPEEWCDMEAEDRALYQQCGSLAEYVRQKQINRNAMLQGMHDRKELFFTMELTDEVLQFLTNQQHMRLGMHNGRRGIFVTKIPYQAEAYLQETDIKRKRYYACHCPLVREAILRDDPIAPEVCHCSLGYSSHALAGLGVPLTGEVLQSVAQGDDCCRFVYYLPEGNAAEKA